jgi:gluconate 2-dehydrogenase gamma chain
MLKARPHPGLRVAVSWYKNLSRREFIQLAAAAAAASGTISCSGSRTPWRFLRVGEARTLAAICDQLIPPDQDPGADWAQVVNFMDIQLCGPFRDAQALYRDGIASANTTAQAQFGKPFAGLIGDQQVEILSALESGNAPKAIWATVDPRRFFETMLAHTMDGFYGDPRHGGNRAHASWKMVGLPYPPVRGRSRYDASKA